MGSTTTIGVSLVAAIQALFTSCGDGGVNCDTEPYEADVALTPAQLERYLDAEGALSDEECARLCSDWEHAFDSPPTYLYEVAWDACDVEVDGDARVVTCMGTGTTSCSIPGRDSVHVRFAPVGAGPDALTAWLAASQHAEAASVVSFLALRRELVEHGAPRDLVDGALRAARDEVIHARLCGRLAQRRGGVLRRVRSRRVATRDLETIARENAVEGCVRETWAAVVASHQARYAEHPEVRAIFMRIADDEIRHAELARSIDLWARSVLDDAAQARVDAARRQARRDLEERMGQPSSVLVRQAGLPPLRRARRLVRGLRPALDAPV